MVTPGTRPTDSDRNDTCQMLDSALGQVQLSMGEHRERVSAATNPTTLGELRALVSDLQIHQAPAHLKSPSGSRRGIVDPRNDRRAVSYDFQNGGWIQIPAGMIPTGTAVPDLGKFGVTAVVGALRDAPQTLKIADPKITYLIIQGMPGGNLDMSIYVGDTADHTGYTKIAPDGTVTAIYPPDY